MKWYGFFEPHQTGGSSFVTIDENSIISHMKEVYPDDYTSLNNEDIILDFCAVHWAFEIDIKAFNVDAPPNYISLLSVAQEAANLRDSGYDGPFIGDIVEPLFKSIAQMEAK